MEEASTIINKMKGLFCMDAFDDFITQMQSDEQFQAEWEDWCRELYSKTQQDEKIFQQWHQEARADESDLPF